MGIPKNNSLDRSAQDWIKSAAHLVADKRRKHWIQLVSLLVLGLTGRMGLMTGTILIFSQSNLIPSPQRLVSRLDC